MDAVSVVGSKRESRPQIVCLSKSLHMKFSNLTPLE
jgi:hypothetical protein